MNIQSIFSVITITVLISACGLRNQNSDFSAEGETRTSPYIMVKHNGESLTVDSNCTENLARREALRESDVTAATVSRYFSTCRVSSSSRGSHQRNSYAINLSYFYPYNYQSYNYNNGFGCNFFFGSYASNWNSNCLSTWGGYSPYWYGGNNWSYNNSCYNYYSNYNYGYAYSSSYYSYPSYCYNRMY